MMFYLAKTPFWVKKLFPDSIWDISGNTKTIYLSFDDGPHPLITPFVLDELLKYNAKATFFCIGKNVLEQPFVYNRIIEAGHSVGNHTHNHLNGWKTSTKTYIDNVEEAGKFIDSGLFRPPYGKITRAQHTCLQQLHSPFKVVMWDILSGDFDMGISANQCYENVVRNATSGSVVVFHDSEKAFDRLKFALPRVLEYYAARGFVFEKITL